LAKMGIYKISCSANGKIYIGSSNNLRKRQYEHKRRLDGNYHHNPHLQKAWNKYGEKAFTIEILEEVKDQCLLIEREQYWIDKTKCYEPDKGYNISPTAGGTYGYKYTEEQKKHCSEWVRSKECREKIRNAKLGTKASKETREKLSIARTGSNNSMYGKTRPEEVRTKISETRKRKGVGRGSNHNKAKLNEDDVREIRKLMDAGMTATEVARRYGVCKSTTARINKGIIWSHVERNDTSLFY